MSYTLLAAIWSLVAIIAWPLASAILSSWRQWRMLKALPAPPATSWLWGHVGAILSTKSPLILAEWTAKYGSTYRIRFLHKWAVIITEPALVRSVLQNSKTYIPKERKLYHAIETANQPHLPNILTSSDTANDAASGKYWAVVRGAWMKCFTSTNLKRVLPVVTDLCATVIDQQTAAAAGTALDGSASDDLAGWAAVNMCDLTDRITLDVIGVVAYGRDFGAVSQKRNRYLQLVSAMLALMHEEMDGPLQRMARTLFGNDKQKEQLRCEWNAANEAEVLAAIKNPPGDHTIAGQLLQVKDPATGKALTVDQLKSEMVIAALAGFETTSNALSWTLGALACHPQVLQKLEQELDSVGLLATPANPHPQPFTWQLMGKLQFLQAIIREGLRLFSPAANGSFRFHATADVTLRDGLIVRKGTAVGVPFYAFGHNPETYGSDVEAFRPERWLQGRSTSSSGNNSSSLNDLAGKSSSSTNSSDSEDAVDADLATSKDASTADVSATAGVQTGGVGRVKFKPPQDPWSFSIGPRDCAGQALARMELQVVIAMLVGALDIKLHPSIDGWEGLLKRRMYHTTLQIEGGLPMLLRPRVQSMSAQ